LPPTLPEEIDKGQDWRAKIDEALAQAECFLLLYTGPNLDWSWCFYEAGAFAKMGRPRRKIFCLHPATQGPPSPLANLQTIRVESKPLGDWIKDDLRSITGRPQPTAKELSKIIKNIKELEEDKKKRASILNRSDCSASWTNTTELISSLAFRGSKSC
jgi:hypothetical protein